MSQEGVHDTFVDTGELDIASRGSRRVWLVKMPQFILDAWKQAGPDAELGRVRVTQKGPTSEVSNRSIILDPSFFFLPLSLPFMQQFQCTMSLSGPSAANLPKEYRLNLAPAPTPIYAFSEDAQGNVALEGAVKNRGDVGPMDGDSVEYRNLVRRRTVESDTKSRGVQLHNDAQMPIKPVNSSRVISTLTGKVCYYCFLPL